jgi:cation transport ATPase
VAGLSMMQVMMYVAPAYLAEDGTLDDSMAALMRWASLLLTLPAICYSALPFWRGAWTSLARARSAWTCRWRWASPPLSAPAWWPPSAAKATCGSTR